MNTPTSRKISSPQENGQSKVKTSSPCPARKVIEDAMALGPMTGWRDGWLTFDKGLCEPFQGASRIALWRCKGRAWAITAEQLPSLIQSSMVRLRILQLPLISADEATIPQDALIAAEVTLSNLAHSYRWEWEHANPNHSWKIELLPKAILDPWTTMCARLEMPGVGLSLGAFFNARYRIRDDAMWSEEEPYAERIDNINFEPAVFGSREERVFMGCLVETTAIFSVSIKAFVDAQQAVMSDDPRALRAALREVKRAADTMVTAFNKISTTETSGDNNYCDPIIWGNTVGPFYASINPEDDSPGGSGLYHPVFHMMDAFFGRVRYDSKLGVEAFHLRHWFPKNVRNLIEALDDPKLCIPKYVDKLEARRAAGEDVPPVRRAFDQARLAYMGERGWLGAHRYKVYGFLQIVSKAGRSGTNGGIAEGEKPWEAVHRELHESRIERLPPGESVIKRDGAGMCPYLASVKARNPIDEDPSRRTQQVVLEVPEGLWWKPGDRLLTIVPNSADAVAATIASLRRKPDDKILLDQKWSRWFEQAGKTLGLPSTRGQGVPLETIVKFSTLRPLGYREVLAIQAGLSNHVKDETCHLHMYLKHTPAWPIRQTVAALINDAVPALLPMKLSGSQICLILSPQTPRAYSISNSAPEDEWEETKSHVELTVARQDFTCAGDEFRLASEKFGVSSGFFSPPPEASSTTSVGGENVLIGLQSPLNFSLPHGDSPVVMMAAGSGIGPFRSFWQHRQRHPHSQTWLLFGCRDEETLLYRDEMDALLRRGQCDFRPYITFSRAKDKRVEFGPDGLKIVDGASRGKYVADMIKEDELLASAIVDLLLPTKVGGRGGSFYVCGNVPFYKGLMGSLKSVLMARNIDASELIKTAFSERRFMVEAFGSASGSNERLLKDGSVAKSVDCKAPFVWQSEMVLASGRRDTNYGQWLAINGNVYDVTEFAHTHPGGKRIINDVCGTDATETFCQVAHDVNSEVIGAMEGMHVGQLKHIDGSLIKDTALAKTETGRWLPELMDVARKMLYDCVELQNVFENEFDSHLENDEATRTRRLAKFCRRFLQEFDSGERGCLGHRVAEEICRLSCQIAGSTRPMKELKPWETTEYGNLADYVSLIDDVLFEIDWLDSVAARLTSQAKFDHDGINVILTAVGKQGLETLENVKCAMVKAVKDLERVFEAACAEKEADLAGLLQSCIDLPGTLALIIATGNAAAATVVVTQPSGKVHSDKKASSLMELRALHSRKTGNSQNTSSGGVDSEPTPVIQSTPMERTNLQLSRSARRGKSEDCTALVMLQSRAELWCLAAPQPTAAASPPPRRRYDVKGGNERKIRRN